jgi:hypothetical protein
MMMMSKNRPVADIMPLNTLKMIGTLLRNTVQCWDEVWRTKRCFKEQFNRVYGINRSLLSVYGSGDAESVCGANFLQFRRTVSCAY